MSTLATIPNVPKCCCLMPSQCCTGVDGQKLQFRGSGLADTGSQCSRVLPFPGARVHWYTPLMFVGSHEDHVGYQWEFHKCQENAQEEFGLLRDFSCFSEISFIRAKATWNERHLAKANIASATNYNWINGRQQSWLLSWNEQYVETK